MAKVKQTWPITAFDAVGIRANQGKFVIQGIDGDEVILEGTSQPDIPGVLILDRTEGG